jgi:hypothetical protein
MLKTEAYRTNIDSQSQSIIIFTEVMLISKSFMEESHDILEARLQDKAFRPLALK